MVPGRALPEVRDSDPVRLGPQRQSNSSTRGGQAFLDLSGGEMPASGRLQQSNRFTFSEEHSALTASKDNNDESK